MGKAMSNAKKKPEHTVVARVYNAISDTPGFGVADIAELTGLTEQRVYMAIWRLLQTGFIIQQQAAGKVSARQGTFQTVRPYVHAEVSKADADRRAKTRQNVAAKRATVVTKPMYPKTMDKVMTAMTAPVVQQQPPPAMKTAEDVLHIICNQMTVYEFTRLKSQLHSVMS